MSSSSTNNNNSSTWDEQTDEAVGKISKNMESIVDSLHVLAKDENS